VHYVLTDKINASICIRIRQILKDQICIRRMQIFDRLRHITTYSSSMPYECLSKMQLSYVIFHVMSRCYVAVSNSLCCNVYIYLPPKLQSYGGINVYISVINRLKFYQ